MKVIYRPSYPDVYRSDRASEPGRTLHRSYDIDVQGK